MTINKGNFISRIDRKIPVWSAILLLVVASSITYYHVESRYLRQIRQDSEYISFLNDKLSSLNKTTINMVCALFNDRSLSCSPTIKTEQGIRFFYKPHGIEEGNYTLYNCLYSLLNDTLVKCDQMNVTIST